MRQEVEQAAASLIGLEVTIVRYAGSMRNLHFGPIRTSKGQQVGAYALHIQCPWRLEGKGRILTGFHDHYTPAVGNEDPDWSPDSNAKGSLQQQVLDQIFLSKSPRKVLAVRADIFGTLVLRFTGGLRLRVFPAASTEEHWRLFQPHRKAKHFVVDAHLCYRE